MTYIKENKKSYGVDEIAKLIKENTEFDVLEDISLRTKRDDVLAFILQCDVGRLKQDFEEDEIEIDSEEDEVYASELMNKADARSKLDLLVPYSTDASMPSRTSGSTEAIFSSRFTRGMKFSFSSGVRGYCR